MSPPTLPEELLEQILLHLRVMPDKDHDEENKLRVDTLLACVRVSKAMARIASVALYHTLDMLSTDHQKYVPLILHLARRPALARHVKQLFALDMRLEQDHDIETLCIRSEAMFVKSAVAVARDTAGLSPEMIEDLIETFSFSPYSACMIVLLALCPHIETLEFNTPFPIPTKDPIIITLLRKLTRLREVTVGQSQLSALETNDIIPLLSSPQLRTLRLKEIVWTERSSLATGQTSRLEHLYLTYTSISTGGLISVLSTFPFLQTLHIEWYPGGDFPGVVPFHDLGITLQQRGSRLRNLRFDTNLRNSEGCRLSTQIASLASLDNLRYLSLPSEALVADGTNDDGGTNVPQDPTPSPWSPLATVVPRSLRLLRVYDEWNTEGEALRVDEQLALLMGDPGFSQLRRIRVRRRAAFTADAKALGWSEVALDNQYWMMLDRKVAR